MASRIKELKDIIVSQNTAVAAFQKDKIDTTDALKQLYTALVKYKADFTTNAVTPESSAYPDMRHEDLIALSKSELISRIGTAFGALVTSVTELRDEVRDVYKELDADADAAIDTWRQLSLVGNQKDQMHSFRANALASASSVRAQTPDPIYPTNIGVMSGQTLPPTPPASAHKSDKREEKGSKSPVHAVKLGKLTAETKDSKSSIPQKK